MSLAAAKEVSRDPAVAAVLSELDDGFTLKKEQRTVKAILGGNYVVFRLAMARVR